MADDPNRDLLPVREGSCVDTSRSSIDPRERHLVYKLDRYELEDRYLRLLEEARHLKKLSNCQEDKIKRLATKLMRVTANPRACNIALDVYDDKNRIIALELENSKLKDKIAVLRNQVLSHKISGRSSSRSRNPQTRPSSGRITYRSECSRGKIPPCHCITEAGDDNHPQNNLDAIEKLIAQKKEMANRITELEKDLSESAASNHRGKVAENVEYIKVWRQMKQFNDKLIATEETNKSLNTQIDNLKWQLEEATKRNYELTAELISDKKQLTEMEDEVIKIKGSQSSLREKEEQIKDLTNEIKILQQHNNELIELSSKHGSIEQENIQLKKKVKEYLHDQETLKSAFNSEQTNIMALQASNDQLLEKLQELQKNIDFLTVQLTSFQTHPEKQETSKTSQISTKQSDVSSLQPADKVVSYKSTASQMGRCKKCCEAFEKILQLEDNMGVPRRIINPIDKGIQTELINQFVTTKTKDQGTSVMTPLKEKLNKHESESVKENVGQILTENPLTPEQMLKLLEQAQISTPMNATRFAKQTVTNNVDYDTVELNQRHSNTEMFVQAKPASSCQQQKNNNDTDTTQPLESQFADPNKILSIVFNILQGYSQTRSIPNRVTKFRRPISSPAYQFVTDINNNVATKSCYVNCTKSSSKFGATNWNVYAKTPRIGCSTKKFYLNPNNRLRSDKFRRKVLGDNKKRNRSIRFEKVNGCTCNDIMKCNVNTNCDQRCCNSRFLKPSIKNAFNYTSKDEEFPKDSSPIKNNLDSSVDDFTSAVPNMEFVSRKLQDVDGVDMYEARNKRIFPSKTNELSNDENMLQEYIQQLDKCKELVNETYSLTNAARIPVNEIMNHTNLKSAMRYQDCSDESTMDIEKAESLRSQNCQDECIDALSSLSDTFPLIIAEGQGLVELHIASLQLSTCAKQILFRESDIDNVWLFVSWELWNQEITYTPTMKSPKLNFNSSFVYRISDLFSFFNYVLLEFVIFQVNVYHEDKDSYTVAKGKLCIKDILDYPQNKLHYIAPVNSVIPCSLGMNFGQLSLWVRLSCDVEKVELFKKTRGIVTEYRDTVKEYSSVLTQPDIEKPASVSPSLENDLTVLVDSNSEARMIYEHTKEVTPQFRVAEYQDESSDTSDPLMTNIQSFNKIPLTVVKKSEDEYHLHSSYENMNRIEIPSTFDTDERVSSNDVAKNMFEQDFEKSSESKGAIDNETFVTESTEGPKSSVEKFNALISKEEPHFSQEDSDESISEVTNVISEKNWEKYKQRSMLTFASTRGTETGHTLTDSEAEIIADYQRLEVDTIVIDILKIIFFPTSSVMQNNDVQLLYVEYSFLGYSGADMETMSVEKPRLPETKLTYNFRRKFRVDEEKHSMQNSILRAMLDDTTNPNIRFVVVSEPLPEETDTKECVEVGYANFNIKKYAFADREKVVSLPIYSTEENEQIGLLKIYMMGLDTIRQRLGRRESSI